MSAALSWLRAKWRSDILALVFASMVPLYHIVFSSKLLGSNFESLILALSQEQSIGWTKNMPP